MIFIIGLVSSAVVMNLPKDPPAAKQMAEGLTRQLNIAAQESLLSGTPFALGVSERGYSLLTYDGTDWVTTDSREWADDLEAKLTKNGESIKLTEEPLPHILFEPTGVSSVFALSLSNFEASYSLLSLGDGRVALEIE